MLILRYLTSVSRSLAFAMDYRFVSACTLVGPARLTFCVQQEIAWNLKGQVAKCDHREYGHATIQITQSDQGSVDALFEHLGDEMQVRVSR